MNRMHRFIMAAIFAGTGLLSLFAQNPPSVNLAEKFITADGFLIRSRDGGKAVFTENAIKATLPTEKSFIQIKSKQNIKIEKGKKYLASIDAEILNTKSTRQGRLLFQIYNTSNNAHGWVGLNGSGSKRLTFLLPFESDRIFKGGKFPPNVIINISGIAGEFRFSNCRVTEIPSDSQMQRGVKFPNGKVLPTAIYQIR